jgi:hypothetical protein
MGSCCSTTRVSWRTLSWSTYVSQKPVDKYTNTAYTGINKHTVSTSIHKSIAPLMNQNYPTTPRHVVHQDYQNQYALGTSRTHSLQSQKRAPETVQEKVYDIRTSDPDSTDSKIGSLARTDSGYDSISGPDRSPNLINPPLRTDSFMPGVPDEISVRFDSSAQRPVKKKIFPWL